MYLILLDFSIFRDTLVYTSVHTYFAVPVSTVEPVHWTQTSVDQWSHSGALKRTLLTWKTCTTKHMLQSDSMAAMAATMAPMAATMDPMAATMAPMAVLG